MQEQLKLHVSRYMFASGYARDKIVLDVACGEGYGTRLMKIKGATIAVGGDLSEESAVYANDNWISNDLYYLRMDAQTLPFKSEFFDLVVSHEAIEHFPDFNSFLQESKRVLKTEGVFICGTPNRLIFSGGSATPWCPEHIKEFDIEEFRGLLSRYFNHVALYGLVRNAVPPSRVERAAYSFGKTLKLILGVPGLAQIVNLMLSSDSPMRIMNLGEVQQDPPENLLDQRYAPFALSFDGSEKPKFVIAVASNNAVTERTSL